MLRSARRDYECKANICKIVLYFQVTREDHGLWMCLINDNKNFDSVKQFVSVEVGVIPDTGVSIEAGNMWDADTETRVEVVEGDNIALSCYARHGFPPSLVSWEHDITNDTSLRYKIIIMLHNHKSVAVAFIITKN